MEAIKGEPVTDSDDPGGMSGIPDPDPDADDDEGLTGDSADAFLRAAGRRRPARAAVNGALLALPSQGAIRCTEARRPAAAERQRSGAACRP